ncbi:MAG TPA: hypothetical protein PK546_09215 [Chitinophagales bacterium]|nr:hypothetical protein [Chitinophagales bacterium]
MKSLFILLISILSTVATFASDADAIDYNDKIVTEQNKIGEAILAFSSNPNDFTLNQIKIQADEGLEVLNSMKPFEGNKKFLSAAKALFKFYGEITGNEYKKILLLIKEKDKYTNEEINAKVNELTGSISKKENPLDVQFKEAQVEFAGKYNFTLTKNELEEKINKLKEK